MEEVGWSDILKDLKKLAAILPLVVAILEIVKKD